MYPASFKEYRRPSTVSEALELARKWGDEALYMGGGMSLMQALKSRLLAPEYLIDLNGIDDLSGIDVGVEMIRIGAMTRYRDIAICKALGPFQALADAAAHVGDRQVRNRGTIGGSLAWNYTSACTPIAALACRAEIVVMHPSGDASRHTVDDFQRGPLTTALEPNDLLRWVELAIPRNRAGSAYRKWGIVKDALPVIGVGCYVELDEAGHCVGARIAIGGLDNGPERAGEAERALIGQSDLDSQLLLAMIAGTAARSTGTSTDHWVSAEYKSHLIERLVAEMLSLAIKRAKDSNHG